MRRGLIQTRVRVDFQQPHVELTIDKEIIAIEFKCEFPIFWVDFPLDGLHCMDNNALHVCQHFGCITRWISFLAVVEEVRKTHLVPALELAIIFSVPLDCVVREMDELVVDLAAVKVELLS